MRRILTSILIISLMISGFASYGKEQYTSNEDRDTMLAAEKDEDKDKDKDDDKKEETDFDKGYKDGRDIATEDIERFGFISLGNETDIRRRFESRLKDKSKEYGDGFVKGYLDKQKEYIKEQAEGGKNTSGSGDISAIGSEIGKLYGLIDGRKDFEARRPMDYEKSMPKDRDIIKMFDLSSLPKEEEEAFIGNFKKGYQEGYKIAYLEEHLGFPMKNLESGREDGELFGSLLGQVDGRTDFREGRSANADRHYLSDSEIIRKYDLNSDYSEYLEGFIEAFRRFYRENYLEAYRKDKETEINREESGAYESGYKIGQERGKIQANLDYIMGLGNDFNRYMPNENTVRKEYNLSKQGDKYIRSFFNGFYTGYKEHYDKEFKQVFEKSGTQGFKSEEVPLKGLEMASNDESLKLNFQKGTYYNPVRANIKTFEQDIYIGNEYILASKIYNISVTNPSPYVNSKAPVEIALEYYGDFKGGVYLLENGKWTYLNSKVDEDFIITSLKPENLQSATIALLVEKEKERFHDIRGHWAKDEIEAYIRRGVIDGYPDGTFKPDNYITRAEYLVLLSRVYDWKLPKDTSNNHYFKDYGRFNYSDRYISYGYNHKYIIGYPDGYFRPYNHINYKEVDWIMQRVLNDKSFRWRDYAEKMQYEKTVKSRSYENMNNYITRAEFSYLLYKLNEWKY